MRPVVHTQADAALVADVVALGALAPAYTREQHPGLWDCWQSRALWLRTLASMGRDLKASIEEADLYCGQPLPPRPSPVPAACCRVQHAELASLEFLELALAGCLKGATP